MKKKPLVMLTNNSLQQPKVKTNLKTKQKQNKPKNIFQYRNEPSTVVIKRKNFTTIDNSNQLKEFVHFFTEFMHRNNKTYIYICI